MKTYRISVDWQVYGIILVSADSLEEAIRTIELDDDIAFPIEHENVESSLEVNYDVTQETYPDEKIGEEPAQTNWEEKKNKQNKLKCGDCKKIMTENNTYILDPPCSISSWDKNNDQKRKKVFICCGKIRMIDPNSGRLISYPVPDVKCIKEREIK